MVSPPLIRLEDVSKYYWLSEEVKVKALKNINLEIERGGFITIAGPSGSGKSTLLYLVGCLDRPSEGTIYLDGQDISKLSDEELARRRGKKIGFVFQTYNLIPTLNAVQNVELPMIFQGVGKDERRKRALELLEKLGLAHRLKHRPNQLSGGQQQRVAIGRALVNDPELILADEPTGNLDTKTGKEVLGTLDELSEEGKTIVMVTHEAYLEKRGRRTVKIVDGGIVRD